MKDDDLTAQLHAYDLQTYRKFTKEMETDKAVQTLEGILKGISIDGCITTDEVAELQHWMDLHIHLIKHNPFREMVSILRRALEDGIITEEEKEDILWVAERFRARGLYYDFLTHSLQKLQGILHGILGDNIITQAEIESLSEWLQDNEFLKGYYPYDDVDSIVTHVLSDGIITPKESNLLKAYFSVFIDLRKSYNLDSAQLQELRENANITGFCAVCPTIVFEGKTFCFTGESHKAPRVQLRSMVESRGGIFKNTVTKSIDYLVVGGNGNPCWVFSCYGRKVENAVKLKKAGIRIIIIHESDFWDELAN